MSEEGSDVRPEDAVQVAQRALAKCDEIERELHALKKEGEELDARLDSLEEAADDLLGDLDD